MTWSATFTIRHDFYKGKREGTKGFPRFTLERLEAALRARTAAGLTRD